MSQHIPIARPDYDDLCDLPNMMYFRKYAGRYIKCGRRQGRDVYLVYFNLENFSIFNEHYGFHAGDQLLKLTAVSIRAAFPGYLVARISGDHFLLVCESLNIEASILDVREQIHAYGRNANIELKAGILRIEDEETNIGTACDRAKIACDSIAHRYDRTFRWYDDALAWYVERKHYIENNIDRAIRNGWIEVYYQPIVRSVTGDVCEFEALARWDDPRYGLLSPAVFVEVLEEARLIHKLDAHIVRLVCEEWRRVSLESSQWRVPVSINFSRLDFELTDVFDVVDATAREYGVPRQMLHVEVTESALNENADLLGPAVKRFRDAGYQVWLDDFGSGYSSLNTLKDYVFDVVKIDMDFLREFETKPKSRVIISNIVNMAKQLGMQTLIEGVETPEQFRFMRDIGCELMQGYLMGRPQKSEENIQRIIRGELVIEPSSLRGYYDRIGRVNTLSAKPLEFPNGLWREEVSEVEVVPLAVIEREAGVLRFVTANEGFEQVLNEIGLGTIEQAAMLVSEHQHRRTRIVYESIDRAVRSGSVETVEFIIHGHHCVLRMRLVASRDGVDAFLVSLVNLSQFTNVDEDKRFQIALRCLYAVYDQVNAVDLEEGTGTTVFRGNTSIPAMHVGDDATKDVHRFAKRMIHPADRDRFLNFMDFSTAMSRIGASGRAHITDAFRVLEGRGTYGWMVTALIPVQEGENRGILACMRHLNQTVIQTVNENTTIPKSLLWDSLVELVPAGVFWKDAERRFVGVNRNFLDFYEFDSTNDVLGKNDEEMGWHVETDPFKNNEIRVIEQGEAVLNAKGTCIARGEVHHIAASKVPLMRNGEIIGLLGYFTDEGNDSTEKQPLSFGNLVRLAETDQLTGIPNLRGLISSATSYQDAYEETGVEYVFVLADIRDMGGLNDVYGRVFGNRILKTVAYKLVRACGVSSVVARIGGDKFAVISQLTTEVGSEVVCDLVKNTVTNIREVDGIAVRLGCVLGSAINTESNDIEELLSLADERLCVERGNLEQS